MRRLCSSVKALADTKMVQDVHSLASPVSIWTVCWPMPVLVGPPASSPTLRAADRHSSTKKKGPRHPMKSTSADATLSKKSGESVPRRLSRSATWHSGHSVKQVVLNPNEVSSSSCIPISDIPVPSSSRITLLQYAELSRYGLQWCQTCGVFVTESGHLIP